MVAQSRKPSERPSPQPPSCDVIDDGNGKMPYEFEALARFNAERARGILHTPEWIEEMAIQQERFNRWIGQEQGVMPKVRPLRRLA